jgi:RimJ/RimL family protein N-acetyltransferase
LVITRVLTDTDAAGFYAVRRRALQDEPEAFVMMPDEMASMEAVTERFKAEWSGQHGFVMGAFDPELMGIVGCMREPRVKRLHVAVIWGMYLAVERRGHGLGRRLLLDAIARAKEWPEPEQFWLEVTSTNVPARTLYLSCSFQVVGLRQRALRIGDRYYDEEMMALQVR